MKDFNLMQKLFGKHYLGLLLLVVFITLACHTCSGQNLTKTEHGYKGKYLNATRMKNTLSGQLNIAITEINFTGNLDRVEVAKIIESSGGFILSGDAFGIDYILFDNMKTKTQQDSVIRIVLPKLEKWYAKNAVNQ
jgi:hypothetical protein